MNITNVNISLCVIAGAILAPKPIFIFNVTNRAIIIPIMASPATSPDARSVPFSMPASRAFSSLLNFFSTRTLIKPPHNIAAFNVIDR